MPMNPPIHRDKNDTSKYSFEEIAEEFITWDAAITRDTILRISFVESAVTYNFPDQPLAELLPQFLEAYKKVYDEAQAKGLDPDMAQPGQIWALLGVPLGE